MSAIANATIYSCNALEISARRETRCGGVVARRPLIRRCNEHTLAARSMHNVHNYIRAYFLLPPPPPPRFRRVCGKTATRDACELINRLPTVVCKCAQHHIPSHLKEGPHEHTQTHTFLGNKGKPPGISRHANRVVSLSLSLYDTLGCLNTHAAVNSHMRTPPTQHIQRTNPPENVCGTRELCV